MDLGLSEEQEMLKTMARDFLATECTKEWIKEMAEYVAEKGKTVKKYYFYYTTCPKCAKTYGHNYVVAFAKV